MFSRSSKSPLPASPKHATGARNAPFSLIGGDVAISGDICATVDLHIDGVVEGDISCAALVQGPESRIQGQVTARHARLAGMVTGSISAEELIVEDSARITGDIVYDRISIAPGSRIEGRFTHRDNGAGTGELKLITADSAA